ncbi:hypothetical protein MTR67_002890 [Solanum verrucosum]|uniref:Uncharacterized protein n=1 Tax=Solanum verrucosum TaxID=315347 RepID=A0AAF0TDQ3_SOLVR|nr:hypothetical protein MTR67_002890 [Solanum verrucosum]
MRFRLGTNNVFRVPATSRV